MSVRCVCGRERTVHSGLDCGPDTPSAAQTRTITPERLLEENEALRQIIREALEEVDAWADRPALLERMRAAIGSE